MLDFAESRRERISYLVRMTRSVPTRNRETLPTTSRRVSTKSALPSGAYFFLHLKRREAFGSRRAPLGARRRGGRPLRGAAQDVTAVTAVVPPAARAEMFIINRTRALEVISMKHALTLILLITILVACAPQPTAQPAPVEPTTPQIQPKPPTTPGLPTREILAAVKLGTFPIKVKPGDLVKVQWTVNVDPPQAIDATALYYDTQSHPGTFGQGITPATAGYRSITTDPTSPLKAPRTFSTSFLAPDGDIHFRAHAVINGKHYWTNEAAIIVETVTQPSKPEFTIEADDRGFYPQEITVNRGDSLKITFIVRQSNVYYSGLQIRGPSFDTGKIAPGSRQTITLKPDATFTFTSYWPSSGVKKADGKVVVR